MSGDHNKHCSANTGGPAFPSKKRIYRAGYATQEFEPINGMTLRDYFAAKAMQGLCARTDGKGFDFLTFENDPMRVAGWAYDVADEMLKARQS